MPAHPGMEIFFVVPLFLFLKDGFEEGVEHGGGVSVLEFDSAPGHFGPEFAGLSFVFIDWPVSRCPSVPTERGRAPCGRWL